MAWNKSGAERVKSYRVYQELETRHNEALEEIATLRSALNVKDELIRRLAGEIANFPKSQSEVFSPGGELPEASKTGPRPVVRPGAYSSVQDGTSEYDEDEVQIPPIDGLTHIRTPAKKGSAKLS